MQCSVDVTESLVELLCAWCHHSAGQFEPSFRRLLGKWACHATDQNNFICQPIFKIFAAKNSEISRL